MNEEQLLAFKNLAKAQIWITTILLALIATCAEIVYHFVHEAATIPFIILGATTISLLRGAVKDFKHFRDRAKQL